MHKYLLLAAGVLLTLLITVAIFNDSNARAQSNAFNSLTKTIPFKLAKDDKPLLLLETFVDGKGPYRFVLDTGAGSTIISPELAKKLGIKPTNPEKLEKATGAGGQLDVRFAKVNSLQIGEVCREDLGVAIMDLTGISKVVETDLDGIVGYNFLKEYRLTIDYPEQTVSFE